MFEVLMIRMIPCLLLGLACLAGCAFPEVGALEGRVETLERRGDEMAEEMNAMDARLQALAERGAKIATEVRTKLEDMQAQIDVLKAEAVGESGLAAIAELEARVAEIDALIPDLSPPGGDSEEGPGEEPAPAP